MIEDIGFPVTLFSSWREFLLIERIWSVNGRFLDAEEETDIILE